MIRIQDLVQKNGIIIDIAGTDKFEVVGSMAHFMCQIYDLADANSIAAKIVEREKEMSTGIGYGIAIPHARMTGIDRLYMVAGRHAAGLEFNSLDELAVNLIFMMVSPANTSTEHTQALSVLSQIMSYEDVRTRLLAAETPEEFVEIIASAEDKYVGG